MSVGAGLARDGFNAVCLTDRGTCIASKPGSHKCGAMSVGAGLARDGFHAVCLTDRGTCIAGKPAPRSAA